MELATLSVCRMEPNPKYGRRASLVTPGFAATVAVVGWLMSASRCKCTPLRPTYPTLTSDFPEHLAFEM